jgi:hypothetical protein
MNLKRALAQSNRAVALAQELRLRFTDSSPSRGRAFMAR